MGITEHAQGELGDIVHLDIAEVGTQFNKGDGIVSALVLPQSSIFIIILPSLFSAELRV
jgi:hypothetical protein